MLIRVYPYSLAYRWLYNNTHAASNPQGGLLRGNQMYQVTAVYQGAEIGYGEGEGLSYAKQDAVDSIPSIYTPILDQIEWIVIHSEI